MTDMAQDPASCTMKKLQPIINKRNREILPPPKNGKGMCLTTGLAHRQSFEGLIFVVEYEDYKETNCGCNY